VSASLYHSHPAVVEASNRALLALTGIVNGGQREGKTAPGFTNKVSFSTIKI